MCCKHERLNPLNNAYFLAFIEQGRFKLFAVFHDFDLFFQFSTGNLSCNRPLLPRAGNSPLLAQFEFH